MRGGPVATFWVKAAVDQGERSAVAEQSTVEYAATTSGAVLPGG